MLRNASFCFVHTCAPGRCDLIKQRVHIRPIKRLLFFEREGARNGGKVEFDVRTAALEVHAITHSVGVTPQYASALGKTANCQTLVSLTLARGEVPVMVALRLFLPESWTSDPVRLKRAGVPAEYQTARTKPEIALAEIDRMMAAGVRFGCVLADAGYGPHKMIYNRFVRWSRLGVFNKIFAELTRKAGKPRRRMIDATHMKAHRTAASLLKKGLFPDVSGARKAA